MTESLPYPDLTGLPPDLARAVSRLVRLINELRRRRPDLDRIAMSVETDLDRRALLIIDAHVERLGLSFTVLPSPWDGRALLEGRGRDGEPLPPDDDTP